MLSSQAAVQPHQATELPMLSTTETPSWEHRLQQYANTQSDKHVHQAEIPVYDEVCQA